MAQTERPERPTGGVVPFLTIRGGRAADAVAFYVAAFGAEETERNVAQDGVRLMQAGLRLNGGWIMVSDEFPEYDGKHEPAPTGTTLHLQVGDTDAAYARACAAGAEGTMPPADMFWGDRYAQLRDPFGHMWSLGAKLG